MKNKEIIKLLKRAVIVFQLNNINTFKIKSYQSAIESLEKVDIPIAKLHTTDLEKIDGVGKGIASSIQEIIKTGTFLELQKLLDKTSPELISLAQIKGIGPKKTLTFCKETGLESWQAMLEEAQKGNLSKLKGFGEKTQERIKQILLFKKANLGKYRYADVFLLAEEWLDYLKKSLPEASISLAGPIRRRLEIIDKINVVVATNNFDQAMAILNDYQGICHSLQDSGPFMWRGIFRDSDLIAEARLCPKEDYARTLFLRTGAPSHLALKANESQNFYDLVDQKKFSSEEQIYLKAGVQYIAPELREGMKEVEWARNKLPELIKMKDLRGVIHNHSTYSDGKHSLREMAEYCKSLGYEYLGISDHSKSAFYANGLYENKVREQQKEIDKLNQELAPFKIFKGIESDILNDGSLDYSDEVLASFDFVISSIHSNLTMDLQKATQRLIKAIENPYTTMLGHPTGRLLLNRPAYPIDHKAIIDACADHNVIIEVNANPWRLDLDWRWIPYALEKNVMLSINPDAHEKEAYSDMYFGVCTARKGGLTKKMTFNAMSVQDVSQYFDNRKKKQ